MKTSIVLAGLALSAMVACTVNVPEPTASDAHGDESLLSDLRAGRALYIGKCAGCHALYPVERYSDTEWRRTVQAMIDFNKVKLSPQDRKRLELYLTRKKAPE